MKTSPFICLTALLLAAPAALANGGGYIDYHDGADAYSSIIPFEMEDIGSIAMETEDLRVELGPGTSKIRVRYTMRNTKDTKVHCRFGFPLDFAQRTQRNAFMKRNDYTVKVNGKRIPAKCVKNPDPPHPDRIGFYHNVSDPVPCWMVSELNVAPNEEFTLEISLTAPNLEENIAVDRESGVTNTLFHYRFSSAAVWNGPIRKGHVEFIPKGVPPDGVRPKLPANRFSRRSSDGAWVWDFSDLEPTLDDDVTFQVVPGTGYGYAEVDGRDENVVCCGGDWSCRIRPEKWAMEASQNAATGPAKTFWTTDAPDNGIGQSVTLNFRKKTPVSLLILNNGSEKRKDACRQYGRVRRLRVVINGSWSQDYEVKDEGLTSLVLHNAPAAKTLKLIILEATPGSKPATAIQGLEVYRPLPKKPNLHMGR